MNGSPAPAQDPRHDDASAESAAIFLANAAQAERRGPRTLRQFRFTYEERHIISKALMARLTDLTARLADDPESSREVYVLRQALERLQD